MGKKQITVFLWEEDIAWLRDHPSFRASGIVEEFINEKRGFKSRGEEPTNENSRKDKEQ